MTTLMLETEPLATHIEMADDKLIVNLVDGRSLMIPLSWYPRLLYATKEERENWEILGDGYAIAWDDLDEHIGIEGLLAGKSSGESDRSFERWLTTRIISSSKTSIIIMTLNQKQLDILQAIQKGYRSDHKISDYLGCDVSLVGYYLEEMKKNGYVDVQHYEDYGGARKLVSLTNKGKVALNNPDKLITVKTPTMNNINNFNAPINAPIGVLQNSDGNTVNITQNNNQNIQEIIKSLEFLEKEVQVFPEEEKQEALVYLDQLKTEIKESQNPAKIRTFFKGFMKIAIPLASLIINGADFANNVTDLATKFDVDISHIALPFQ